MPRLAFNPRSHGTLGSLRTAVVLVLLLSALAMCVTAQPFVVNSTRDKADQSPGDGVCYTGSLNPDGSKECTLRAAIQEANASSVARVITLPAGTYDLTLPSACSYQITTNTGFVNLTVISLCFLGQITIQGAGAASTIIDA